MKWVDSPDDMQAFYCRTLSGAVRYNDLCIEYMNSLIRFYPAPVRSLTGRLLDHCMRAGTLSSKIGRTCCTLSNFSAHWIERSFDAFTDAHKTLSHPGVLCHSAHNNRPDIDLIVHTI